MSKLYENKAIREEAKSIVQHYVLHRANELADFAFQNMHNLDMNGIDQFSEDMVKYDYDQAATDWNKELTGEDRAEYLENNELSEQELNDWVFEYPEAVCSDEMIDPEPVEIFEFWVVDNWFANRLAERGEAVSDLFDFKIWGRSTTGQAIAMDYLILSIAEENIKAREG